MELVEAQDHLRFQKQQNDQVTSRIWKGPIRFAMSLGLTPVRDLSCRISAHSISASPKDAAQILTVICVQAQGHLVELMSQLAAGYATFEQQHKASQHRLHEAAELEQALHQLAEAAVPALEPPTTSGTEVSVKLTPAGQYRCH